MNQQYSTIVKEIIEELESRNPLPPLSPTEEWSSRLTARLENYSLGDLFDGFAVTDPEFGECAKSGLLLWNDALDSSHRSYRISELKRGITGTPSCIAAKMTTATQNIGLDELESIQFILNYTVML